MLMLARKLKKTKPAITQDDPSESRFKLLHLPILAIQNCLRFLTVFQFLDFSLLSKRSKAIASTIRRDKIGIEFSINEDSRLLLTLPNFPNNKWLIHFRVDLSTSEMLVSRVINGTSVLSTVQTNTVKSGSGEKNYYSLIFPRKNILENMKWISKHLCVVFRSPIQLMDIEYFEDPFIHFFEWLHTFQQSIDFICIEGKEISTKSLLFILNNFQIHKDLRLLVEPSEHSFEYTQPVNTHSLGISFSQWKLNNILCSQNSSIDLPNSCLTPEDINCLLKHWIGGWNKNLCYLELIRKVEHEEVEEEVFKILSKDIKWKEHSRDSGRPAYHTLYNGTVMPTYQGEQAEIERDDGRIAAFAQVYEYVDGKVLHWFVLQAWDRK